jgi:hypothetical protein
MWLHDIGARIVRSTGLHGSAYSLHVPGDPPVRLETKNPVRRAGARAA